MGLPRLLPSPAPPRNPRRQARMLTLPPAVVSMDVRRQEEVVRQARAAAGGDSNGGPEGSSLIVRPRRAGTAHRIAVPLLPMSSSAVIGAHNPSRRHLY
jgi:hypothetical protein